MPDLHEQYVYGDPSGEYPIHPAILPYIKLPDNRPGELALKVIKDGRVEELKAVCLLLDVDPKGVITEWGQTVSGQTIDICKFNERLRDEQQRTNY